MDEQFPVLATGRLTRKVCGSALRGEVAAGALSAFATNGPLIAIRNNVDVLVASQLDTSSPAGSSRNDGQIESLGSDTALVTR